MRTIWLERLICCHFILQNKWLDKHRRHRWVSGSGVELREECSQHNWQRFRKPVPCRGHAHGCLANTKLMNRKVSSQTVILQPIRGCSEWNVPVIMCLSCFVCLDADKWSIANYRGGVMLNRQSLWLWFISYKMKVFVETSKTLMTPTPYFLVNIMLFRIICQDDTANVVAKGRGAHRENIWQSILITLTHHNELQGSFKLMESSSAGMWRYSTQVKGSLWNVSLSITTCGWNSKLSKSFNLENGLG